MAALVEEASTKTNYQKKKRKKMIVMMKMMRMMMILSCLTTSLQRNSIRSFRIEDLFILILISNKIPMEMKDIELNRPIDSNHRIANTITKELSSN